MITDADIQKTCTQVNAFAGLSAVWINESGTLKTAPQPGTDARQRGKHVGIYLRVTPNDLANDIANAKAGRQTFAKHITDPQIAAVFGEIVSKPRASTIVWVCNRTGRLKCSTESPAKWPVTEKSPGYVGIYTRMTTLPDLTEDTLHAFDELRKANDINTAPPRKHRVQRAAA